MTARRYLRVYRSIRDGFWLRPLCLLALGVGLGFVSTRLDHWLADTSRTTPFGRVASPSGARAVLAAASGALATTLAISLSLTMVTVQLASSQFTPRLMRRFLGDRFTQRVLGSFLAVIAYTFLILSAIRSPDEGVPFVPLVSLTAAIALTLACLALLVVFLHRTMRSMQASTLIAAIGTDASAVIRKHPISHLTPAPSEPSGAFVVVHASSPGYVQVVDDDGIRNAVRGLSATLVRRDAGPGCFLVEGDPLLTIFGTASITDALRANIRERFMIGSERTHESDVGFGVRHLVDMGLKALSPGINDVTTGVMVVNELGVLAREVCRQGIADRPWRVDPTLAGTPYSVRVLELDTLLDLAFGEIALASVTMPRVHMRIIELLCGLGRDASAASQPIIEQHLSRLRAMLAPNQPTDRGVPIAVREAYLAASLLLPGREARSNDGPVRLP